MGKNRTIKSLGKVIGNVVIHKILFKYTNNPKSVNRLTAEVGTYRDNAIEIAHEFNWNEEDKQRIKQEAIKEFGKRILKYRDVNFPDSEVIIFLDETIKECLG